MLNGIKGDIVVSTKKEETLKLRAEGYSYAEIGRIQNLSINTVKSRVRRNGLKVNFIKKTWTISEAEKKRIEKIISAPTHYRNCMQCGVNMVLTQRNKRFCGDKCRSMWWGSHHECSNGIKLRTIHVCKNCNKEFYGPGKDRKYCNHDCYISARYGAYPQKNINSELNGNFENALSLYKRGISCASISDYLKISKEIIKTWIKNLSSEFSNYSNTAINSTQEWKHRISMDNPDGEEPRKNADIYLVCGKTNFGRKFEDLITIIKYQFEITPQNGDKFVFCGLGNTKIKIIEYVKNNFLSTEKRLHYGSFPWPPKSLGEVLKITEEDFKNLMKYSVKPWTKFFS